MVRVNRQERKETGVRVKRGERKGAEEKERGSRVGRKETMTRER